MFRFVINCAPSSLWTMMDDDRRDWLTDNAIDKMGNNHAKKQKKPQFSANELDVLESSFHYVAGAQKQQITEPTLMVKMDEFRYNAIIHFVIFLENFLITLIRWLLIGWLVGRFLCLSYSQIPLSLLSLFGCLVLFKVIWTVKRIQGHSLPIHSFKVSRHFSNDPLQSSFRTSSFFLLVDF